MPPPSPPVYNPQSLVKDYSESGTTVWDLYDGVPQPGSDRGGAKLGTGGTASVFKVTQKQTKKQYACKVVPLGRIRDKQVRTMLLSEIDTIKKLDHPNCIKILEVFVEPNCIYIIMELCTGGELFDKLCVVVIVCHISLDV